KRKSVDYIPKEDATKFIFEKNGLPQIFSLALDKKLVIDQRPLRSQVIPLGFMVDKDMDLPITISQRNGGKNKYCLWIEDSYSGDIWDVNDGEVFSLPVKKEDVGDRWKLHIDVDEPEDSLPIKIFHKDHGVRIESLTSLTKQISVYNVLGETVTSFVLEGFDDKNIDLSKGIFLLKIVSEGVITTTKIVVY
ncbi:MAG: T9SS type A sorting domain-containing protein, partial [Prolixibacteraceae bacterium]